MVINMDIEEMIAMALARGEAEYAELLADMSEENLALVLEFPDNKTAENGYLLA